MITAGPDDRLWSEGCTMVAMLAFPDGSILIWSRVSGIYCAPWGHSNVFASIDVDYAYKLIRLLALSVRIEYNGKFKRSQC